MGRRKPIAPDERMEKKNCPTYITSVKQEGDDAGIVEAIVAVMGNIDDGDDIIHPGAFAMTIAERGNKIRVLDSHNWMSAENAIGKVLDIREVGREELPTEILTQFPDAAGGLWTRSQFLLDEPTDKSAKIFRRIKAGMISEWSIGYDAFDTDVTMEGEGDDERPIRNIRTVRLWEFSPVVFAMNSATATTNVKNQNGNTVDPDADTTPVELVDETPDEIIEQIEQELDTTSTDTTPELGGVRLYDDSKELINKLESLIEIAQGFVKQLQSEQVDGETPEQVGSDNGTQASMPAEEDAETKRQRLLARIKEEKING